MKSVFKGIAVIGLILYPFFVGYALAHNQFFWVSVLLLVLGIMRLFSRDNPLLWPLTGLAILCGGLSLILKDQAWLKLYPVLMNLGALIIFSVTLIKPPSMIERFARLVEPDLPPEGIQWTRQVTWVWCGFFAVNGSLSLLTVLFAPMQIWVLYNGFIAYVLMGMLLLGEWLLRKRQQRFNETRINKSTTSQ